VGITMPSAMPSPAKAVLLPLLLLAGTAASAGDDMRRPKKLIPS
jgi:hypothetical protein